MPIGLDKTGSRSAVNALSVTQYKNTHIKNTDDCLRIEVIQKMIYRFLTEKRMPKQNLAEVLEITVKSLNQLCSKGASQALILKVNLPLVKLYCKTRF